MSTRLSVGVLEGGNKGLQEDLSVQQLALVRSLGLFFNLAPGDSLFDRTNANAGGGALVPIGVAAPIAPGMITLVNFTSDRLEGLVLAGWATSPTGVAVRYRILVNGTVVLECSQQPTVDLFTVSPIGITIGEGPVQVLLQCGSTGVGAVAGVFGRLTGYWRGGDRATPRRLVR